MRFENAQLKAEIDRRLAIALEEARKRPTYATELKAVLRHSLHRRQREVFDSPARFKSLCCSRRAGKTALLARLIICLLLGAGFNQWVIFAAPTLDIGKDLIWAELTMLIDSLNLGWETLDHRGIVKLPNGARFKILGLDNVRQVAKVRGYDMVGFLADEVQNYEHLIEPLLVSLAPALSGRRGMFVASGTPGPALRGFWFRICHGEDGFKTFHWDIRQNPKNPRPGEDVLQEERERNGWSEQHPTYIREWLGIWVEDSNFMVCDFAHARNTLAEAPTDYGAHWRHVIGIDYGFVDATAWVVIAVNPFTGETLVVHAEKHETLIGDKAAEITATLVKRFGTTYVVCDPAGGGKPFFETFNAKYGSVLSCRIRSADKVDKFGSINLLNTELRTARLKFLLPDSDAAVREVQVLRWKDEYKEALQEGADYPDHCFDALRYALVEAAPWAVKGAPKKETPEDVQRAERAKRIRAQQQKQWWERRG